MDTREKIIALINETKETRDCLLAGAYELAYQHTQNLEDELTTMAIKMVAEEQERASSQPPRETKPNP